MDLPDYSQQLMQQLGALRAEGRFCDCTILVGDAPHTAHKLVMGASSMLFRYSLHSWLSGGGAQCIESSGHTVQMHVTFFN